MKTLKYVLIAQVILCGIAFTYLICLGVSDFDIYFSIFTLIYIITMAIASPLPKKVKRINIVFTTALLTVFFFFVTNRILKILGYPTIIEYLMMYYAS